MADFADSFSGLDAVIEYHNRRMSDAVAEYYEEVAARNAEIEQRDRELEAQLLELQRSEARRLEVEAAATASEMAESDADCASSPVSGRAPTSDGDEDFENRSWLR